jgi:hypothetical protein
VISTLLPTLSQHLLHRVWVISDLQQALPRRARECLTTALDDFRSLNMPVEQIWYLGDGVEGTRLDFLEEVSAMQIEKLNALNVPIKYVLGNHDFDHLAHHRGATAAAAVFRDAVRRQPNWRTTDSLESFYFIDRIGTFTVLFLSDHADPQGRWISTHGSVQGERRLYPHGPDAYQRLRDELITIKDPIITCSHYAFAGGNRPSPLHNQLLPLPRNVRLHLYGHAHIGDAAWAGKDRFRKIACIDDHPIVQADVASLENDRGNATRSAILEIYRNLSLGILFRNHSARSWEDALFLEAPPVDDTPPA